MFSSSEFLSLHGSRPFDSNPGSFTQRHVYFMPRRSQHREHKLSDDNNHRPTKPTRHACPPHAVGALRCEVGERAGNVYPAHTDSRSLYLTPLSYPYFYLPLSPLSLLIVSLRSRYLLNNPALDDPGRVAALYRGRRRFETRSRAFFPALATWQIDQKSEKGVFRRGYQKASTAGFTPHTMIDAAGFGVDEVAGI
jgi:hypothetical protein